jgi:hypothetical protein
MRTLISLIVVVLLSLSLNINGQELKSSDLVTTTITVDDIYKITGTTYEQFVEIKAAVKQVNSLKKNKYKYGIDHYRALVSTVMSGLKLKGIKVTTI